MLFNKSLIVLLVSTLIYLCYGANQVSTSTGSNRQSTAAAVGGTGILSAIGSLIPGAIGNVLPLVLLFSLGALMVPALGLGLLLREGRRRYISDHPSLHGAPLTWSLSPSMSSDHAYYYRSFPAFKMINTSAIMDGLSDVFERVMRALDNVDKKYN